MAEPDLQPSRRPGRVKTAIVGVILLTAVVLLLAGLIISPSWVARHFRPGRLLRRESIGEQYHVLTFDVPQGVPASAGQFTMMRGDDGSVQFDRTTPEGVSVRKRFFFPPTTEKTDNFVAEMDVDFRNDGTLPYTNAGYFVSLGSTRPLHPKDLPSNTRLVWCIEGSANETQVTWFAGGGGFLGVGQHPPRPLYQEKVAGAEWAAMTNQFFTTILTPINAKVSEAWTQPFEIKGTVIPPLQGMDGAMGMPGFVLQPGQSSTVRFQIYTGPKLYARLAKLTARRESEIAGARRRLGVTPVFKRPTTVTSADPSRRRLGFCRSGSTASGIHSGIPVELPQNVITQL
jgi:hypothetical protein